MGAVKSSQLSQNYHSYGIKIAILTITSSVLR
nr:MAG TPA: hypothetical protein [Caudoviricetes sp.]